LTASYFDLFKYRRSSVLAVHLRTFSLWVQRIRPLSHRCYSFIRPGFLLEKHTRCPPDNRSISISISESRKHYLAFYMINETVRVSVHDLAFVAIHRWNVLVVKFVDMSVVPLAHIDVSIYLAVLCNYALYLLACLSFVANLPLNTFIFTLPCLSTASRIRSSTLLTSSKTAAARCD